MPGIRYFDPVLLRWQIFLLLYSSYPSAMMQIMHGCARVCLAIGIALLIYFHLDGYVIIIFILEGCVNYTF